MIGFQSSSSFVLGSPDWLWPALGTGLLFLAVLAGLSLRLSRPARWKWGLLTLKTGAVSLLAVCLLNPLLNRSRVKPGENVVILLADESASMRIGTGRGHSRGEELKRLLADPDSPWVTRLQQDFEVRRYTFGENLKLVEGFQTLTFEAPASRLSWALNTIGDRFRASRSGSRLEREGGTGRPLAAVLLFSDGNSTDLLPPENWDREVPIFPILLPEGAPAPDLSIRSLSVSQTPFEDAPVSVQATIAVQGPMEGNVVVTLTPVPGGDEGQRQQVTLPLNGEEPVTARFQIRPLEPGVLFYRLRVRAEDEPDAFERPDGSREATLANNERLIAVDRGSHVSRVLYVAGRPNWEHKYLNRALAEDEQVQLVSLIRIARKEAKFDFRGRAGESTNPLFRGFRAETDEETEAYDEPVLVRLNTRDGDELRDGFPKTKETLYEYDAIVLDDIESQFFSHDQLGLLDRFVSERGGSLLMLGGRDSFRHGDWQKTPLRDLLPLYLDRATPVVSGEVAWSLTRDGWLEPWMRLRETEGAEQQRLAEMPLFTVVTPADQPKPGARVLAEVEDASGNRLPALVTQSYGRGRGAALLVGDLWKWSLRREEGAEDDPAKAWRQMLRWLVADVPGRISVGTEWIQLGQTAAVRLEVRLRDPEYQPQENATVRITVEQPDGKTIDLEAEPGLREAGLFETDYVPRLPGAYRAKVRVFDDQGRRERSTEVGWTSNPEADEFRETRIDRRALSELAEPTGGEPVPSEELERFVSGLSYRPMPVTEIETTPLWHSPWLLLAALALLAGEWGLRRWKGLP